MKILDLGCGKKKYPGAIGIDRSPESDADIIHDLNHLPYPFRSNTFDLIICDNVLEHLKEPLLVIEEIHRLLKPEGIVRIITPHFSSDDSFTDITHRHHFSFRSFNIFTNDSSSFSFYTRARFEMIKKRIMFGRLKRYVGIESLANKLPQIYESHFVFIFQAHSLFFEMKAVK